MKIHPPDNPLKKSKTVSWRHIVLLGNLGDESAWIMGSLTEVQESPESKVLRDEQNEQVQRLLARLTGEERNIIHWKFGFYSHPLTNKEIGRHLGCSKEAARQRLERLYRILRRYLQEENETP